MRKIVVALVVLMLAAPAWAEVHVYCTDDNGEVTISYDATSEPNLVRGFALDITVDSGAQITSVTELDDVNYWFHPGTIEINDTTFLVDSNGTALADPCDHPDTKPGPPSVGITIEMGSLYYPATGTASPNSPGKLGDLVKLVVDNSCVMTIAENAIRGGVVMENPDEVVDVNLGTCEIDVGCATCVGDLTGDSRLRVNDLGELVNLFTLYGTNIPSTHASFNPCGDVTCDGRLRVNDYGKIVSLFTAQGSTNIHCTAVPAGWPCNWP